MSNRKNLSQAAGEIVDFVDKHPTDTGRKGGGSHDVSNEPRVPKGTPMAGNGRQERHLALAPLTEERDGARDERDDRAPDGVVEIREGGTAAWRNTIQATSTLEPGPIVTVRLDVMARGPCSG